MKRGILITGFLLGQAAFAIVGLIAGSRGYGFWWWVLFAFGIIGAIAVLIVDVKVTKMLNEEREL